MRLWNEQHTLPMTLKTAANLCQRCHLAAPFCFYNGNTFTAIIRDAILQLNLEAEQAYVIRSLAGHIVAGVATGEEEKAFKEFSDALE